MRRVGAASARLLSSAGAKPGVLLEHGRKSLPRDPTASLELFQKARAAAHQRQDRKGEAEAVLELAKACKAQGMAAAFVSHLQEYVTMMGPDGMDDATRAFVSFELGYSFFASGDARAAVTYLQAARLAARQAGKPGLEAWALAYLGTLYARRGEPVTGVQLLQRGANTMRDANDASGQRRILLMTAAVQQELGQLDDAIASYSAATTLARKANDIRNEGKIYRLVGAVLEQKKDLQSATHSYKVAVQLASQSGDDLGLVASALLLGNVIALASPLSAESVVYWKQALRTCKAMVVSDRKKLLPMQSQALYRLTAYYEATKQFQAALGLRAELTELMRSTKLPQGLATALQDVAELQARLGMAAAAEASFREAVDAWSAVSEGRVSQGAARAGLAGVLLLQGLTHEAKTEAAQAVALLDSAPVPAVPSRKQPTAAARARALALAGDILARSGAAEQGRALAQRALQMSEMTDKDTACLARLILARCLVEAGDLDEAKKLAKLGLSHSVSSQLLPQIYQGLEVQADICLRENNADGAMKYLEKMLRVAGDKSGMVSWRAAAMQRLADLHEKKGEFEAAERLHRGAVGLLAGHPGRSAMRSMLALVRLYENLGNAEAAASFGRMLKHVAREKE